MVWKEIELKRDFWTPICEGEVLEGVLIDINNEGKFGTEYTIETKDGLHTKLPAHAVLMTLMEEVLIGKKIKVTFKGEKPTNKGNPVQIYKLEVWEDEPQSE